jgi:hypothetical protein
VIAVRSCLVRLASAGRAATVVLLIATAGCAAPGASSGAPLVTGLPPSTAPAFKPSPPNPQPPVALLTVGSSGPTPGAIGSYTYLGTGSDAPWLPGTPTTVPSRGGRATIVLQPAVATAAWTVRQAQTGDTDGTTARRIAAGTGPIAFALPTGSGTIVLVVDFAAGAGSASYFWALSPG